MKKITVFIRAALGILFVFVTTLSAQVPQLINYQGVLREPSTGDPISGSKSMTFSIYSVPQAGTPLWSETQAVEVKDGHFSVLIGLQVNIPISVFSGGEQYLGVKIENDTEMTPRKPIASVGYAIMSANTDKVDGQKLNSNDGSVNQSSDPVSWYKIKDIPAGFADGTDDGGSGGGGISQIDVGAGMTVTNPTGPTASLGLNMGHGNNIDADMVDGNHASNFANASHSHSGGDITSGKISNTRLNTGSGNGLDADLVDGKHASGFANVSHDHIGEKWTGSVPWNNAILIAQNNSNGPGLWGHNTGGGNGVRGTATGGGIGIFGQHTGSGPGVSGISTGGNGVEGSTSANGVSASGVKGTSSGNNGNGVRGEANNGSSAFGIWGKSTNGYAGWFDGKVQVTGTLSKGGGSFKIDHPLDPANKYLYHSFVESPDMMNVYNGNITLDTHGEATVTMPDWFEALNKNFRYQLTSLGAPGPNLYIANEISGNRFRIAGGAPGMKVSWQVTGVRQDAFANAHRIKVEVEKSGLEKGKYLHPKEHGMAETFGMESVKTNVEH